MRPVTARHPDSAFWRAGGRAGVGVSGVGCRGPGCAGGLIAARPGLQFAGICDYGRTIKKYQLPKVYFDFMVDSIERDV